MVRRTSKMRIFERLSLKQQDVKAAEEDDTTSQESKNSVRVTGVGYLMTATQSMHSHSLM